MGFKEYSASDSQGRNGSREQSVPLVGIFSKADRNSFTKGRGKGTLAYWFARERNPGAIHLQMLNKDLVPSGKLERMSRDVFLKDYTLEPEIWYKLVTRRIDQGDWFRGKNQFLEAKIEYNKALGVDDANIRAMFGLGLCYLALDELEKAQYVFDKLVNIEETFEEEHKHLFNEFGIAMRRKGLLSSAESFYAKALELTSEDEHLFLNKARVRYERGNIEGAFRDLSKAFLVNSNHPAALAFLKHLSKKKLKAHDEEVASILTPFVQPALCSTLKMEDYFE